MLCRHFVRASTSLARLPKTVLAQPQVACMVSSNNQRFLSGGRRKFERREKREKEVPKQEPRKPEFENPVDLSGANIAPNGDVPSIILEEIKKRGTTIYVHESAQKNQVIDDLLRTGIDAQFVVDICVHNPDLYVAMLSNPDDLIKMVKTMVSVGNLDHHDALRILAEFTSDLLACDASDVRDRIEALSACGITPAKAIRRCPPLLFARDPQEMRKLAEAIGSFFSRRQASHLMSRCPEILLKSIEEIENKYEYVFYKMNVDGQELSECGVAWIDKLTVEDMAMRHEFLTLCGKYTLPDPKRPQIRKENPKLTRIFDTPDSQFAVQVADVSVEEWIVFKALCAKRAANQHKERLYEKIKPSKRKAYERKLKTKEKSPDYVFEEYKNAE